MAGRPSPEIPEAWKEPSVQLEDSKHHVHELCYHDHRGHHKKHDDYEHHEHDEHHDRHGHDDQQEDSHTIKKHQQHYPPHHHASKCPSEVSNSISKDHLDPSTLRYEVAQTTVITIAHEFWATRYFFRQLRGIIPQFEELNRNGSAAKWPMKQEGANFIIPKDRRQDDINGLLELIQPIQQGLTTAPAPFQPSDSFTNVWTTYCSSFIKHIRGHLEHMFCDVRDARIRLGHRSLGTGFVDQLQQRMDSLDEFAKPMTERCYGLVSLHAMYDTVIAQRVQMEEYLVARGLIARRNWRTANRPDPIAALQKTSGPSGRAHGIESAMDSISLGDWEAREIIEGHLVLNNKKYEIEECLEKLATIIYKAKLRKDYFSIKAINKGFSNIHSMSFINRLTKEKAREHFIMQCEAIDGVDIASVNWGHLKPHNRTVDGILICPWYTNGTLFDWAQDKNLLTLMKLFFQVAQSLAYVHGKGLVHNDLKPESVALMRSIRQITDVRISNIFIDTEGNALLGDLDSITVAGDSHSRITHTDFYSAPEICHWSSTGSIGYQHGNQPPADIFSWGVTMLVVLYGEEDFLVGRPPGFLVDSEQLKVYFERSMRRYEGTTKQKEAILKVLQQTLQQDPSERPKAQDLVLLMKHLLHHHFSHHN